MQPEPATAAIGVEWSAPRTAPVTIAREDFETFLRDGKELWIEHAAEVGKAATFNIELARLLDRIGAGIIMVARAEGRMVGYLVMIVGPSLVDPAETDAMSTGFYVSPPYRGRTGIRLLKAAIEACWARGVDDITLRAGVVGSGFHLDAMFQRLGAVPHGRLYNLRRR